jgi:hypothetical protein
MRSVIYRSGNMREEIKIPLEVIMARREWSIVVVSKVINVDSFTAAYRVTRVHCLGTFQTLRPVFLVLKTANVPRSVKVDFLLKSEKIDDRLRKNNGRGVL